MALSMEALLTAEHGSSTHGARIELGSCDGFVKARLDRLLECLLHKQREDPKNKLSWKGLQENGVTGLLRGRRGEQRSFSLLLFDLNLV